jgi:hypothetical protein
MDFAMWEHVLLIIRFLNVAKLTTQTSLSLLVSCKSSSHLLVLKISYIPAISEKYETCRGKNLDCYVPTPPKAPDKLVRFLY